MAEKKRRGFMTTGTPRNSSNSGKPKPDAPTEKTKDEEIQKLKGSLDEKDKQLAEKTKTVDDLSFKLAKETDEVCQKTLEIEELNFVVTEQKGQLEKYKTQEKQMEDLVERIKLKEAENAIYKQDFETERNDRQRIHDEYEGLKLKFEELKTSHEQLKSKKQSDIELARLKQMLDDKEELLRSYGQERASLKEQLETLKNECEGLKRANKAVNGTKLHKKDAANQDQNTLHIHDIYKPSDNSQASTGDNETFDTMRNVKPHIDTTCIYKPGDSSQASTGDEEPFDSMKNVEPQLTRDEMTALFKPAQPKPIKDSSHL